MGERIAQGSFTPNGAGLPLSAVLAPLAVAGEVAAGVSLLLGAWGRAGALLAVPVVAYAQIAISEWPNNGDEPPLALPLIVFAGAGCVAWRGAGGWRFDARRVGDCVR